MSNPQQGQGQYQQAYQGGNAPVAAPQHAPVPAGTGYNMKRRNPAAAWLGLPIITFGIYGLVWFYKVHAELYNYDRRTGDAATSALLSMLLGGITLGIWPLIMYVKLGGRIAQAQRAAGLQPSCSGGVAFLLGLIGFGVLYYQLQLNKVIERYGDTPAGQQVSLAA
ncbi:DUF4234 domain-containing protein [Spirillospora albida]|uniref:DUF4234 domain-containing protein n=1 Tax=Spirillospora albida TaxID=58123 RepID=UPI0004C1F2D8|nr:DUF4234 domain-containing protein [Spirillospora albida]